MCDVFGTDSWFGGLDLIPGVDQGLVSSSDSCAALSNTYCVDMRLNKLGAAVRPGMLDYEHV